MELKEGDEFTRLEGSDNIKIQKIETYRVDKDKKKMKLDNFIITMEYVNSTKKPFTTYESEVQRMISWNRWKKL